MTLGNARLARHGWVWMLVGLLVVACAAPVALADPGGPTAEDRQIAVAVVSLLRRDHLSSHPLDDETKRAVPASVAGWLLKPVDLDQLAEAVSRALARSEPAESA